MSKVKKSKGKSKTYARKSRSSGPSPIEAAREFIQQYALAGVAGVIVILASAGAILWAGGYVGILTDKMARAADAGAVAAGFEDDLREEIHPPPHPVFRCDQRLGQPVRRFDVQVGGRNRVFVRV